MATDRKDFSQEEINEVWEKAIPQPKNNPDLFRKDYAGAWIRKDAYGEQSEYGWEIDHIKPLAIYSQTQVTYQVLVPQTAVDLKGKSISSVKAYYYDSTSETYKPLLAKGVSGVNAVEASKQSGDIYVYTTNGMLVKHIAAKNVAEQYGDVLNSLSHGIYVVKEGGKTRKIIF